MPKLPRSWLQLLQIIERKTCTRLTLEKLEAGRISRNGKSCTASPISYNLKLTFPIVRLEDSDVCAMCGLHKNLGIWDLSLALLLKLTWRLVGIQDGMDYFYTHESPSLFLPEFFVWSCKSGTSYVCTTEEVIVQENATPYSRAWKNMGPCSLDLLSTTNAGGVIVHNT